MMSEMATVLVVDDEPIVRDVVVRYLQRDGYDTLEAADGDSARAIIESGRADLVVLDLMLPGTDGLALCRWIRSGSDLPVIMLTALGEAADRIVGLELGADDYVTKPFSPRELAIRVRNVLKRAETPPLVAETLSFDGLTIDGRTRDVSLDGESLRLTGREFDLLFFLASNASEVFSRAQLMERVWGYEAALDTGTVTVHIRRLRSKIERDPSMPRYLETLWGVGYRFAP
jgi:DNA-binding response OmpR family regulator